METALHPRDVLEGIFYFYPDDTFENNRETIHTAIYKIREKHFDLLGDITFRKHILFPRSRVLDELLSSLQPGLLFKRNPTYDTYEIKRINLKKSWETYLKEEFIGKEDELKSMAAEFKNLMTGINNA